MAKELGTRDLLINRFAEIRPSVTSEDRREAVSSLSITYTSVSNYLNGEVKNIDLGMKLLLFFQGRIKERNELIKAIA